MFSALLTSAILLAVDPSSSAQPEPASVVLKSGHLELTFDGSRGTVRELRYRGQVLSRSDEGSVTFDLSEDGKWVVGGNRVEPRLTRLAQPDARTAVASFAVGLWQVDLRYELDAEWPMVSRSAKVTWQGKEPTKLKGFWMGQPVLAVGADGYYFSPGSYPPRRFSAREFRAGQHRSFGQSLRPLVAELGPGRSVVCLSDELSPAADRGSVSVREMDGAIRIQQSFTAQGRMKPGDCQEIGRASLWIVDGDGETAMRRIPEWMRREGHVPPADRAAWFREAVIYSFHPGGTIGSTFKDLGGFQAAMPLLDEIAELGANAIWIMPIEDAGVYHPRDYYKFQEGLGTADDYRALVAKAHRLGLKVLQDCVPHGGSNHYPRAKEHPEWLAYEEDGSTLPYWCYDFNWPTWRAYMAQVARHYVSQFGVDGYRVDAVAGSRIPNWNPEIPYARASFAQLQGGLNMLRSLRGAVKELKPAEGGLLAEVQGSVYGTVSDAIYDFAGCYNVHHDLRRLPPEEFVNRLRRWLHEQQYAETPDLLRLRHVESHDSLRSQLWFGVEPARAMTAMTAWIHGIPLVYHEMERGHSRVFRRIFAIRRRLPELGGGAADYLSVEAPAGVFACLRTAGDNASVVLVNMAGTKVQGAVRVPQAVLPEKLRRQAVVSDLWLNRPVAGVSCQEERVNVPVALPPFGFTVLALRADGPVTLPVEPDPWTKAVDAAKEKDSRPQAADRASDDGIRLEGNDYVAWISRESGLLKRLSIGGTEVLGAADLYLPAGWREHAEKTVLRQEGNAAVLERGFGRARLTLRYVPERGSLRLETAWSGDVPTQAAMYLPVVRASRWFAATAEGVLEDAYRVRHLPTEGVTGSIYWRPQGTNVVWDSMLVPLGPDPEERSIGAIGAGRAVALRLVDPVAPARVRWIDRVGQRQELAALVSWQDRQAPRVGRPATWTVELVPHAELPATSFAGQLRPAGGGWEFENEHYRLRLGRSGTITGLWTKGPQARTVIEQGELYTDHGYGEARMRYAASNDVEAASRIWREDGQLRVRFEGRLRGFGRFERLRPPVDYLFDYTLGAGSSLRVSCGVKPHRNPSEKAAFLAMMLPIPEMRGATYHRDGKLLAKGERQRGRTWQSKTQTPPVVPDRIELAAGEGRLLELSGLICGTSTPLANVFCDGQNFFLAFDDGEPKDCGRRWRWFSALLTAGDGVASPIGRPCLPAAEQASADLLADPGFEEGVQSRSVSLETGVAMPGEQTDLAWQPPQGGRLVSQPVHQGAAAAEVENTSGAYLLWRQAVPVAELPAGSRWRLTAWVKGENIQRGDVGWKVGTLRFAPVTDRITYASCPELLGTFSWKQVAVEFTVPEKLRSVDVEVGLNGATGKMWIDDVRLERRE
jgi:hypothetical protein